MKKVVIFGAGISGLTVAHQLSLLPDYEIHIYEKQNDIGGLAKSKRDINGCATEICWRVFFGFYDNLFQLMKEIPADENTVHNNLTLYTHKNLVDTKISAHDLILAYGNIIYGLTSCDERLQEHDRISWWQSLRITTSSNIYREIGPWLGMDRYCGSYYSVIRVGMEMQMIPSLLHPNYHDYITTKPTSEAWFSHWKRLLEQRGVSIHTNAPLESLSITGHRIISATVNSSEITADHYVIAMPVEALSELIDKIPQLNIGDLQNIKPLKQTSLHTQLSFQVYFNRRINLGVRAFLLVDSPWDLIVLSYDETYLNNLCTYLPQVRGGWSVAVCTAYTQGIVYGKPFNECSYDEIIEELWTQLSRSKSLQDVINGQL